MTEANASYDGLARINLSAVMPGLVPGIHALAAKKGVYGQDKPGHDDV